jgi:hypothetical protein
MTAPLKLDEIIGQQVKATRQPSPLGHNGGPPMTEQELLAVEQVQRLIIKEQWKTTEANAAYFLNVLMQGIEALAQGNFLTTGQAIDDALTHYLADLKARTGEDYADIAGLHIINNIAEILSARKKTTIKAAVAACA